MSLRQSGACDSTFVCPTEITAFSDAVDKFHALNTEVIGVSVDSKFSHLAWINTPRKQGGLGELRYPLVSDLTKEIARKYNVLLEDGIALRYGGGARNMRRGIQPALIRGQVRLLTARRHWPQRHVYN